MKPAGRWVDFHIYDLDAGITLFVQPTDRFKNTFLRMFVRSHLSEDASATAVLPHILMRGTRRRPTMAKVCAHLDTLFGSSASADSGKIGENQVLSFRVDAVNDRHLPGRSRNVRRGLEFLREMALDPAREGRELRHDYVEQEVHNQKRALEDLMSDRAEWASQRCVEEMCRGEAYAVHEMGSLEGLARATPASITARHRELLEKCPVEIYVAGRVKPDEIATLCNDLFHARVRRAPRQVPDTVVDVPVKSPRRITETMDVEQGKLVMGYRTYTTYRDRLSTALSFLNGIFGGFSHSRLFLNVREREGLAYSAGSSLEKTKGLLMVYAGIDVEKFDKCLAVIGEELESIRAGKVTDEELEATRKALSERARGVLDSPSRAIYGLFERRLSGRVQTVEEVLKEIAATTKADVVEVANRVKLDLVYWLTRT